MMPVAVLPVGGKTPVVILFVLGVLAVAMLVNRPPAIPSQPQF
jgi:hypothetical protein